jgi:hypothetical protein
LEVELARPGWDAAFLCALGLVTSAAAAAEKRTGMLSLKVRDSTSGIAVDPFDIEISASPSIRAAHDRGTGIATFEVTPELVPVKVVASGYRPLSTQLKVLADASALPVTIWLDPEVEGEKLSRLRTEKSRQGRVLVEGYVVDEAGRPLENAAIQLKEQLVRTEPSGRFQFDLPELATGRDLPELADLTVELPGYRRHRLSNLPIAGGEIHLMVEMGVGEGLDSEDQTPKIMRSAEEQLNSQLDFGDEAKFPTGTRALARIIVPPSIIRVGFTCSCRNCSTVQVMSLETYVRRGLKAEWISSWTQHSLRSGAIAYRSYGAWYVNNPIDAAYDICSTACCQVNTSGTVGSTDDAVAHTPGILLQAAGEIFRAEYSAENNNNACGATSCSNHDCTCGNGSAGSPSYGWPCVTESWDLNAACSGHGRGMCQWGSQRASLQGRLWNWIEDHYYNNNGAPGGLRSAYMTSPVDIADFSSDPTAISAGDTLNLWYSVYNYAELPHNQLLLGASLYSPSVGYVSDSVDDLLTSAPPGSSDQYRWFSTPSWLPSGSYDLLVALWIDVDEDGAITSVDLPLVTYSWPGAITVF